MGNKIKINSHNCMVEVQTNSKWFIPLFAFNIQFRFEEIKYKLSDKEIHETKF